MKTDTRINDVITKLQNEPELTDLVGKEENAMKTVQLMSLDGIGMRI